MALLIVLGLVRLLFPGDVPFIADEPLIVDHALDGWEARTVATSGLEGTRGATYGPAPTWFYEVALAFTADLRAVAAAKIILVTGLSALALMLLGRSLSGLSLPLAAFAFLSPYLWFYARDLWDNSFAIPLSAMLLASYLRFHETERFRWLAAAGLFAVLCLLTHFMTVPLVGAVALHFAISRGRAMRASPGLTLRVGALAGACGLALLPYLSQVSAVSAGSLLWSPSPRSLAFALDGFRLFTLTGFDYVVGSWNAGGTGPVLRTVSALTYPVGLYGAYLMNRELRRGHAWRAEAETSSAVAAVVALTLVLFVVVANGKRLIEHPHYYSGVWVVFFLLWWTGMSALVRSAWARRMFGAQAGVMIVFLLGLIGWLHTNHGTRSLHYGPTLANQMSVAHELERLGVEDAPPSAAHHPRLFPQAIRVLRRLDARGHDPASPLRATPRTGYMIVYADPDGESGEILLRPEPEG